jgi:hypothetical protein
MTHDPHGLVYGVIFNTTLEQEQYAALLLKYCGCGARAIVGDAVRLAQTPDDSERFRLVRCPRCGLGRTPPRVPNYIAKPGEPPA